MRDTEFTRRLVQSLRRDRIMGRRYKRPPRRIRGWAWKYPLALELKYRKGLQAYFQATFGALVERAASELAPVLRQDAAVDVLQDFLLEKQQEWAAGGLRGNFLGGIFTLGEDVNAFNAAEWEKFAKIAIGDAFVPNEPWVKSTLDTWAARQQTLITSLTDNAKTKFLDTVTQSVQKGELYTTVMAKLQAQVGSLSTAKARLLARDQIGKLNADLARQRHAEAGIDEYTWQTVGDERVRGNPSGIYSKAVPSHWAIDGKRCRWDNPTLVMENDKWVSRNALMPREHPGEAIQCRCVGIPFMDDLFAEAANDAGLDPAPMEQGEIPSPSQVEQRINGTPQDIHGDVLMPKFVEGVETLLPDALSAAIENLTPLGAPVPRTLFFAKTTATMETVSAATLREWAKRGIPDNPIRVVRFQGKDYLIGTDSHLRVAMARLLGEYRAPMLRYDLDKYLAKTTLKPALLGVPAVPKPKPAPKVAYVPATPKELRKMLDDGKFDTPADTSVNLAMLEQDTGMDARKLLGSLGILPEDTLLQVSKFRDTWSLEARNGSSRIIRRFTKGKGKTWEVDHEYFKLDEKLRDGGRAKKALTQQFEAYNQSPYITKIRVHAALDNGAYTWGRFGFSPEDSGKWAMARSQVRRNAIEAGDNDALEFLADLTDDPKDMWLLTDSKYGKTLLPGTHWYGHFDFTDAESVSRFNAYTNSSIQVRKAVK